MVSVRRCGGWFCLHKPSKPYWICLWSEYVAKWEMERILCFFFFLKRGKTHTPFYILCFGIIIGRWFRNLADVCVAFFHAAVVGCTYYSSFFFSLWYDSLLCASLFNNNIDIYLRVNIFDAYEINFRWWNLNKWTRFMG